MNKAKKNVYKYADAAGAHLLLCVHIYRIYHALALVLGSLIALCVRLCVCVFVHYVHIDHMASYWLDACSEKSPQVRVPVMLIGQQ